MARIYIARTTGIGSFERHVVLKLITPERANDATAVQMFLDEARLAASLNHQNVAQVFEVGEDAGIHYLAMEYVHGQDLRAILAKAGSQGTRVPLDLALTVVSGACAGLNHAHERRDGNGVPLGIVHRDVSPSNIMIGLDGSVKLLDFGIAKATSRAVETVSGIIKGKFAYMAPEQCRGRDVDRRSDVFSLGIILYEITTQHRCFRADSDFDTMHRIVTGDVVRPARLVQGYPHALEAIVMKALAVDANQRYQSAGMLLEAIEAFALSARMSLSTMALGRFMREMFGETPEPWLMNHAQRAAAQAVPQPKESTISNTNGTGNAQPVRAPSATTNPVSVEQLGMQAAHTMLDLPRGHSQHDQDQPNAAEWNAKSYPTMQPSYASPPPLANAARISSPNLSALQQFTHSPTPSGPTPMPQGSQPVIPTSEAQAFSPHPGSGSGPAHATIPTTRTGYANAPGIRRSNMSHNDVAYPRYEPPEDDLRLRPSRRPLMIGIGILAIGVVIVLVVGLRGGNVETPNTITPSGSDESHTDPGQTVPPTAKVNDPQAPAIVPIDASAAIAVTVDAAVVEPPTVEESIGIRVISDPPGANVLLSGKPIGTTPLDTKIPRGTGAATLRVQRAGYVEIETKIDMTGDFSKEVTLVKVADKADKKPPDKKPDAVKIDKKPPDKKPPDRKLPTNTVTTPDKKPTGTVTTPDKKPTGTVTTPDKKPTGTGTTPDKKPPDKKLPACQDKERANPFDDRPICK